MPRRVEPSRFLFAEGSSIDVCFYFDGLSEAWLKSNQKWLAGRSCEPQESIKSSKNFTKPRKEKKRREKLIFNNKSTIKWTRVNKYRLLRSEREVLAGCWTNREAYHCKADKMKVAEKKNSQLDVLMKNERKWTGASTTSRERILVRLGVENEERRWR